MATSCLPRSCRIFRAWRQKRQRSSGTSSRPKNSEVPWKLAGADIDKDEITSLCDFQVSLNAKHGCRSFQVANRCGSGRRGISIQQQTLTYQKKKGPTSDLPLCKGRLKADRCTGHFAEAPPASRHTHVLRKLTFTRRLCPPCRASSRISAGPTLQRKRGSALCPR